MKKKTILSFVIATIAVCAWAESAYAYVLLSPRLMSLGPLLTLSIESITPFLFLSSNSSSSPHSKKNLKSLR